LTNNKIKNLFCVGTTTAKALELKKIKNIVIAEIPTIEDVIVEVIGIIIQKKVSTHQLKFKYMIKNDLF
jgi:uroporphyrinogen-III synthase